MASLIGKAQDDDDTFWSHSIWSEAGGGFSDKASRKRRREEGASSSESEGGGSGDEGSESDGEGSYRMSDEDPDVLVDKFDSDFDESESDEEVDDGEGEEEQDLRAEERRAAVSKRKKNQRLGVPLKASAGRELMKKKSGKMTKRGPLGEGWNEGLVLRGPPTLGGAAPVVAKSGLAAAAAAPIHTQIVDSKSTAIPGAQSIPPAAQTKPHYIPSQPVILSSIETKQIPTAKPPPSPIRHLRTGETSITAPSAKPFPTALKQQRQTAITERKKIRKRQYTQEELILESIKSTEIENSKWINARKRTKEEVAQSEKAAGAKKSSLNQKPISRFHSRRGCNNTLTFMDMDHLPEILTRRHASSCRSGNLGDSACTVASPKRRRLGSSTSETSESEQVAEKNHEKCVITGKIARYRDPKTMLGYHDLDSYKEIRRRLEAGELKISQPPRNNNRSRKSSGSNDGASAQRKGVNTTKVPFAADQPTMVAGMTSSTRPNVVKVMVTQGGVPVSPPGSAKIPFELLRDQSSLAEGSQSIKKEPPPLPPSAEQTGNGEIGGIKKEPPPLLPSAQQAGDGKIGDISRFLMGRMEMGMETEHQHMHYVKVDKSNPKNDVPKEVASNESAQPTKPAQPIEQPQKLGAGEKNDDDAGDNRKEDGVQPQVTISSSASENVAMVPGTNGKVVTSSAESNEKTKALSAKDISRKSTNDDNKNIAPEVTTSNSKRTTIEAS